MSTKYDGPKEEKRHKRERDFEYLLGKALEQVLGVAKFVYKQIEEIDRKVDGMEVSLDALSAKLDEIDATEGEINTAVVSAGERFTELVEELHNLPAEGGSVTQAQVDAITTKAQAVEGGLTSALNTLVSDTPTGGATNTGEDTNTTQLATVYTFTPGEGISADSRFSVAAVITAPTDGSAAQTLLEFSGDTSPGETNGAQVAGYSVYSGPTQPVTGQGEAPQA